MSLTNKKIYLLAESSFNGIKALMTNFRNLVKNSLLKKKKEIEKLLKEKNWKIIQEEINNEMKEKLKNLNEEIESFFNNINYNSNMLYQKIKKLYFEFTEKKLNLNDIGSFKEYFLSKALKKKDANILDEIYKELEICIEDALGKIFNKKGLFSFFDSLFSNVSYFSNLIEILIEFFSKEISNLLIKIDKNFEEYIEKILNIISSNYTSISFIYTNNQSKEWNTLSSIYKSKRELIYQDLNKLIGNKVD